MSESHKETPEMETAKVRLSSSEWQLDTTVSVPKGPMQPKELLPAAKALADAIVNASIKAVEEEGRRVSCKKGCGACCRQLVPISEMEARQIRDLVNELPEPRRSAIRERFAAARRRLEQSGLLEKLIHRDQWNVDEVQPLGSSYFFQGIPCPFLEEESCSIYNDRPISCREYLVTSPPENCAQPSRERIEQVALPFRIWPALARLEKLAPTGRFVPWVPLILAPEWADAHPAEPRQRPGMELLRELFNQLSAGKSQSTDPYPAASDELSSDVARANEKDLSVQSNDLRATLNAAASTNREFPLRLSDAEDFERVESMLRSAHYDDATICRRFEINDMSDIGSIDREKVDLSGELGLLLRLFLFLELIPRVEVESWLEPNALFCLQRLDLVRIGAFNSENPNRPEMYYSPIWLYPVAGVLIASDRRTNPDGSEFSPMPDIVFPAIYEGSLRFLNAISNRVADDALDLCCGSGIAALVLSRTASRVVASDITSRTCHFAKFNVLLNRRSNIEIAQGDLYDAVRGESFDLIVAHPPYVPSVAQAAIYRDSGETGETLISRIVSGLPDHLRPGGTFVSVCAGWDSNEGVFEERARRWIGKRKNEFSLSFTRERERSVQEVAARLPTLNDSQKEKAPAAWLRLLRGRGLEKRVYGALVIQRSRDNELIES